MSGSFESVRWHACVHRLDLGLYSHPKELGGNGVRTHVNSRGKSPLLEKFSPEEDRTHGTATSRTANPTHYQRAIQTLLMLVSTLKHGKMTRTLDSINMAACMAEAIR